MYATNMQWLSKKLNACAEFVNPYHPPPPKKKYTHSLSHTHNGQLLAVLGGNFTLAVLGGNFRDINAVGNGHFKDCWWQFWTVITCSVIEDL